MIRRGIFILKRQREYLVFNNNFLKEKNAIKFISEFYYK